MRRFLLILSLLALGPACVIDTVPLPEDNPTAADDREDMGTGGDPAGDPPPGDADAAPGDQAGDSD